MSGPVDVLTVMAEASLFLNGTRDARFCVEILEARAAVAELIAASDALERSARKVQSGECGVHGMDVERRACRRVLARIGGAT